MATRKVYSLDAQLHPHTTEQSFRWAKVGNSMFSKASKRATAKNLSKAFTQAHPGYRELEVSSASENPLGKHLSAFSLPFYTRHGTFKLETLYQASKYFASHGSMNDLLKKKPRTAQNWKTHKPETKVRAAYPLEAKRAAGNVNRKDQLTKFQLGNNSYPLQPKGAFYNYLYSIALAEHPKLASQVMQYNAFADVQAGPRVMNTQAQGCAVYSSLKQSGKLRSALHSYGNFLDAVYPDYTPQKSAAPQQRTQQQSQPKPSTKPYHRQTPKNQKLQTKQKPKYHRKTVADRIKSAKGQPSILDTRADAILNPVNTYGSMKYGVNKQLKKRFYPMFQRYRFFCYKNHKINPKTGTYYGVAALKKKDGWHPVYTGRGKGQLQPGRTLYYQDPKSKKYVISVPVKTDPYMNDHFKKTSDRKVIARNQELNRADQKREEANLKLGMQAVVKTAAKHHIKSIAVPRFDRANGGLSWKYQAKPIVEGALKHSGLKYRVYDPYAQPKSEQPAKPSPQVAKTGEIDTDPFKHPQQSAQSSAAQKSQQSSAPANSQSAKPASHKRPAKLHVPDTPMTDPLEKQALSKRLGSQMPRFVNALGNPAALFQHRGKHLTVFGPHKVSQADAKQIAQQTHEMDAHGYVPVTGLNMGSDRAVVSQALKDHQPQVAMVASNFQYLSPSSNRKLFRKITETNGYAMSGHRNTDYVDFKDAKNYRQRDNVLTGIGDGIVISKATMKNGQLSGPGIYNAEFAHDKQYKPVYYMSGVNSPEVEQALRDEIEAKPLSTAWTKQKTHQASQSDSFASARANQQQEAPNPFENDGPAPGDFTPADEDPFPHADNSQQPPAGMDHLSKTKPTPDSGGDGIEP